MEILNPWSRKKMESLLIILKNLEKLHGKIFFLVFQKPIGSHESGLIGEDPFWGKTQNLMPVISRCSRKIRVFFLFWEKTSPKNGTKEIIFINLFSRTLWL
ncbi:MAG: hypothetical protein CM15mP13_0670 [Pseudomonadota bacterium]|nr:MAG: hypothetical protein CM15mP13_0670 [Pseudomonadota bacterium]